MGQNEIQPSIQITAPKRWTTIKVPTELREFIRLLALRENKAEWQVLTNAVSFYYAQTKKPRIKEDASILDKVSWYITKIGSSVGEFKANPTPENFEKLKKTAAQIQERLGVDTSLLVRVAEAYMRYRDEDSRMELNAALKMLILDIIYRKLVEEGRSVDASAHAAQLSEER